MAFSSNDPANYFALSPQTAKGTEQTTGFKFLKYLTGGLEDNIDEQLTYEGGDGQDPGLVYKQHQTRDGSVDVFARPDTFAYLAAWAMGSGVTVPSTGGALGSHIYTPNATVPYLTVEQAWGAGQTIDRVSDAIISGFTVEGESGMPWKITAPFVGGGTPYFRDGTASALSATLESGDPAMYAGGAVLLNGATNIDVTKWSVKFERKVDDALFTNQVFRREVVPLARSVEVDFSVIVQDRNLYKQALYSATAASLIDTNLATSAFHAERQLVSSQLLAIDVPNLRLTDAKVNRLEPDGQTVVIDLTGQGIKAGTGIIQLRANISGRATSYLTYP